MALSASDDDPAKRLEDDPALKALLDLSARVAALEEKVQRLEARQAPAPRAAGNPCPNCGAEMTLRSEVAHPTFALFGIKVRTFECESCHEVTTREHHPERR